MKAHAGLDDAEEGKPAGHTTINFGGRPHNNRLWRGGAEVLIRVDLARPFGPARTMMSRRWRVGHHESVWTRPGSAWETPQVLLGRGRGAARDEAESSDGTRPSLSRE